MKDVGVYRYVPMKEAKKNVSFCLDFIFRKLCPVDNDEMKDSEDDATAVTIQTSEPRQPILKVYSPRQYGTIYRDFQGDWYKKYPWLEYDTELKAATCFTCRTFLNHKCTFFQQKNSERMKNHATSANHVLSAQKWMDSELTASGKKSVLALLKT